MIVKNPDGEEYIVNPDKFAAKYKETETPGVYQPIAEPIQYIPVVESIVFVAPWGEEMYAVEGAVLNVSELDKVYAIQNAAFEKNLRSFRRTSKRLSLIKKHIHSKYVFFVKIEIVDGFDFLHSV